MVSPLGPEDIGVIARMRAHGYAVMLVSPDPVSYEAGIDSGFTDFASRLANAERALMLRQVYRSGVPVVNWNVNQPLENVIRDSLARPPQLISNHIPAA